MATKKATSTKSVASKKTAKAASASAYTSVRDHVSSSLQSASLWRALTAEFIGTFLLAAIIITSQGAPLAILFGIIGIVLVAGAVSGAHLNPAITAAAWVTKRIGWLRALGYVVVQVFAAMVAFFVIKAFVGGADAPSEEAALYGAAAPQVFSATAVTEFAGKEWYVVGSEILGTAILGYAVAFATRAKDALTGAFSVGFGLFAALLITATLAGYVGASAILNPAIAASLQAFSAETWSYAIYALAPIVGGVIGFILYDTLNTQKKSA